MQPWNQAISEGPAPAQTSVASACSTCAARCCLEYTVTVTGYDVWTIATGLGLAPEHFLVHYPTAKPGAGCFRLDQGDARFDVALDKVDVERPHRPCIFLIELPGGGGRCGIHAHRPFVCQTYPSMGDGELVRLRDDVLCPTGAWKLSQMALAAWRRRIADFTWHHDLSEAAVGCWNARVQAAEAGACFSILHYYDFLLNLYGRLDALERLLPGPRRRQIMDSWHEHRREHGNGLAAETVGGTDAPPEDCAEHCGRIREIIAEYRPETVAEADALDPRKGADLGSSTSTEGRTARVAEGRGPG